MNLKHKEKFKPKKLKIINVMSFLMGFSQAILVYVVSSYFKEASGTENVSLFYLISYAVVLIVLLNFHKLVKKFGKFNLFFVSFAAKTFFIASLMAMPISMISAIFLMLYIVFSSISWVSLDLILESFSVDKKSGRIRGLYLTVINAGFVFGPYIAVRILDAFSFKGIFFVVTIFYLIELTIATVYLKGSNHEHLPIETIKQLLQKVSKRKNVLRAYYIAFVLDAFYALMVVFSPLYLLDLGFTWAQIGTMFTIMLAPFVFIEYPAGVLADKHTGEKQLLILALLIISASSFGMFLSDTANVLRWTMLLVFSRTGAALLEVLRDSYFYKRIDKDDVDVIGFFRTARPVAYLVSTSLSAVILLFVSVKFIFFLISLIAFIGIYPAMHLAKNSLAKD